ncbi:putative bifunctional diguanylate cyclase/phosphodiesterase [Croceicoccus estronivorus]|uniref:putative bifunctional diguanylate cyclase/phosphodiesterase n=1 Tax=Croceicoccus estronivorus TaxID=1172626 RepID=UPI000B230E0B|nr:EAL domain-containing protein [Croceicoccus estronivorus]
MGDVQQASGGGQASSGHGEFSVLVIEDNPGDRRLAELALTAGAEGTGAFCEVLLAGTLEEGLQLLATAERNAMHAILLDLGLPDAAGFDGLQRLKSLYPDIPVIILTGQNEEAVAISALKFGAADYLEKDEIRPRSLWRSIGYALERKKLEAELVYLAATDPLTMVKNRRALLEALPLIMENALRSELHCAVLIIDIDNFKQINDLLGHSTGDELLLTVASRISDAIRQTDVVGRLGGDEFAVIATNLKSPEGAIEIAEKITQAIAAVPEINGRPIEISSSVGIALFPSGVENSDELLTHADLAMYKAKKEGRASICLYDESLHHELRRRLLLKRAMVSDMATPGFYLDYQPIVDCKTHEIVSAEGLARWRTRDGKIVMPAEFIPIAEENGWIADLGMRMIEQACEFMSRSLSTGVPVVPISINVSPIQCKDKGFPGEFTRAIERRGLSPTLFNIEITESTFMQDIDGARRGLEALMHVGIGIHIDDFGTGYSSLSLLRDLPLKHLKLDRSFVSRLAEDLGTRPIMEAIIDLARKLEFKTVAEGVETAEQVKLLTEIGIDYLQGYYFSRPISAAKLCEELVMGGVVRNGYGLGLEAGHDMDNADKISRALGR